MIGLEFSGRIIREAINYAYIAKLKAQFNGSKKRGEKRLTNNDFLVLSSGNDPFYADSPGTLKWGQWFAQLWQEHKGHIPMVHVRALHYALVDFADTETPIIMPNGKVYENTINCWKQLELAGKYARYNGLIPSHKFDDRRAQTLVEREYTAASQDVWIVNEGYECDIAFPEFPEMPRYGLTYGSRQRYRLEVWCEKSTQDTVLTPVADRYKVTMLSAQGELSISAIVKAILRSHEADMPTRILYISDFDPAGRSMPVAASRKLEFLQKLMRSEEDIQLYPIALTHEQCVQYRLNRTPIKEKEKRKEKFEDRYGSGATELDALEAKHPGELAKLLEREILKFYDTELSSNTIDERIRLRDDLDSIEGDIHDQHDIKSLKDEYETLKSEFEEWYRDKFEPFRTRLEDAYQGIENDLDENIPDLDQDYSVPEGKEVPVTDDCLYDSQRGYLEQLAAYNEFTGKFSHLIEEDEEEVA